MEQPTEAQIKKFWEKLGYGVVDGYVIFPDKKVRLKSSVDINNLFKYAPKPLEAKEQIILIEPVCDANFSMVGVMGIFTGKKIWKRAEWSDGIKGIETALFWAIWEVIPLAEAIKEIK